MRGLLFFLAFVSSLPFIFVSPFNGVLIWYVFSLGNFHTMIWGGFFASLNYAYFIAILTGISWMFTRSEKKHLPMTPLVILTLLFAFWTTVTSYFALAPSFDVWSAWSETQKILLMCLVGYALTTTKERMDQLIWVVVLSIGVWGVKGAIMSLLHGGTMIHGPDGGRIADNNHFGVALIMILPLLAYHWQLATNRRLRHGLMGLCLLCALATLFTYSRGALLGLCSMGAVFWLRSRAKLSTGLLIAIVTLCIFTLGPKAWFDRMATIEHYEEDGSATGRLDFWRASLRIAAIHPFVGGGFRVTFWPMVTNPMLQGTDIPRYTNGRATHSSYFQALSEHGWVGFILFLMIGAYSWANCSWLIRHSRTRPDLAWADLLGRMGKAALVGYWCAGAFASLAYLDEYWCILFVFDAARRIVAKEIAPPAGAFAMRLRAPPFGMAAPALARPGERPGFVKNRS